MSNIDISSEVGADRLLRRILDGAIANCSTDARPSSLAESTIGIRACMHTSMTRDVAQVESQVVSARFTRIGSNMIERATGGGFARGDDRQSAPVLQLRIQQNTPAVRPTPQLISDELNRSEAVRLREAIAPAH